METTSTAPMRPVRLDVAHRPTPRPRPAERKSDLYREAVFAWNASEEQLGRTVLHARDLPNEDMRLDHPKLVGIALGHLAALEPDDPENQSLAPVANLFGLSDQRVRALERQGVRDVRSLAEAIIVAPVIARANQRREVTRTASPDGARRPEPPGPLQPVLTVPEADALRSAFGASLQARAERAWSEPSDD
jgi:hypothetical protein